MLRRMFALVALVSLLSLAACGSDVTGLQDTRQGIQQDADQVTPEKKHEYSEEKAELEEPPGGGGGGMAPAPVSANQNQKRRNREEIAP